jgi:hypothetical protein
MEIDDTVLNTLLSADDEVLLSYSEGDLQRTLYTLRSSMYSLEWKYLAPPEYEVRTYKGHFPIRSRIVAENTVQGQVNTFALWGCKISYEEDKTIP